MIIIERQYGTSTNRQNTVNTHTLKEKKHSLTESLDADLGKVEVIAMNFNAAAIDAEQAGLQRLLSRTLEYQVEVQLVDHVFTHTIARQCLEVETDQEFSDISLSRIRFLTWR